MNNAADVALLGQVDQLDPAAMLRACAVNTVAPVLLIGWVLRTAPARIPLRIVNVSSGAAVEALPGLGAYGATKAALRMAGMVLGTELDLRAETVLIVHMFQQFAAEGRVLPASLPAAEIVAHLEADGHPRFSEQRFLLT